MKKFAINNFLQHLIHDCGLKKEFVNEMMDYAKQQQISFISYLIQTQKIDSSYLAHLLAEEFFLTYIDLDSIDITQIPSSLIDKNILQKYQMLPITYDRKKLVLALVDPTQQLVLDDIRFATGLILEYKIADEKQIVELLKKVKDTSLIKHDITSQVDLSRYKETQLKEDHDLDIALNNSSNDDLTIINYVHKLLIDAIMRNASDVHIEPYQDHLKIRFRIDGLLYVMVVLPRNLISRITTRLKIMSQLDIAERRIPQDGRFQLKDIKGQNVDCRLSTCPTIHGEKLVIRILDSNKMLLEIDKLGMNKIQKKEFIKALSSPHGMILVTGPTGSGKTITLYT